MVRNFEADSGFYFRSPDFGFDLTFLTRIFGFNLNRSTFEISDGQKSLQTKPKVLSERALQQKLKITLVEFFVQENSLLRLNRNSSKGLAV